MSTDKATLPEVALLSVKAGLERLPAAMDSSRARLMLYAIGMQESRFMHRRQIVGGAPVGPAKGFWQFERGGGCAGVVNHQASRFWMHDVCTKRGVAFSPSALWNAIEFDDTLAAVAARLLLFTDPNPLPEVGDVNGAWDYYMRVWRPGKPHLKTWPLMYAAARGAV